MATFNFTVDTGEEQMVNETMPVDVPESTNDHNQLTVVFTGHRNIASTWCEDYTNMYGQQHWDGVARSLEKFGEWITSHGYTPDQVCFIDGGALGFDLAAVYGLILPWQRMGAHYTLALPWPGYWNPKWDYRRNTADQIRSAYDNADSYLYAQSCDDGNWAKALNARNEVMVNQLGDGDVIMGMWTGVQRGGTWNCLKYAQEKRVGLFSAKFRILTFNPLTKKWGEL